MKRMPFVIRTDTDLETLKRITGMDLKRIEWKPIHIKRVTMEPMKPVKLHMPFIPFRYGEQKEEI